MNARFSSFTPEWAHTFGQTLAADARHRTEALRDTRNHTSAMLTAFRQEHRAAEAGRRQSAARAADARRLFTSDLKAGVHALLGRFELGRKEMAGDLAEMAQELQAARGAFARRPGRQGGNRRGRSRTRGE